MDSHKLVLYETEFKQYNLPHGGEFYTPVEKSVTNGDLEMIIAVDEQLLEPDRRVDRQIPLDHGYRWHQMYYPNKYRSDVYYSEELQQYVKSPVEDKNSVIQFMAMSALYGHVDKDSSISIVNSPWAYKSSRCSHSMLASEAAVGDKVRKIVLLANPFSYDNVLTEMRPIIKKALKERLYPQIPKNLRMLLNDNPAIHGARADYGLHNVLAHVEGVVDYEEMYELLRTDIDSVNLTLIDQAHPDILIKTRHQAERIKSLARRILY